MPSSNVKILVVEPSAKIRQEFQALLETADPKRTGQVHFVAKQSAAQSRIQKDSFDVLLVRLDKNDSRPLLDLAQQKGLVYELLFSVSVQGELLWYLGSLRFGTHKYALRNLQGMGSWWSLKKQDQETPEVYRKLLNRISDGIAEVDVDDTIRWANTALQRALGDVSLAGVSVEQIVKPSDVHQLRTIRQQLNSGVVIPFPVRLATGQLVELDPSFRFGPDGKQLGSSIVFRGVRSNEESERGRELFTLYSVATALSQASNLDDAVSGLLSRIMELMDLAAAGMVIEKAGRQFRQGLSLDDAALGAIDHLGEMVAKKPRALIHREIPQDDSQHFTALLGNGVRGVAVIPLQAQGELLGFMWFCSTEPGHFSREVVSLLISISVQLVVAVENFQHHEDRLKEEASRRQFYRDALAAVTHGKLHLIEGPEMEDTWAASGPLLGERTIRSYADVPGMRKFVEETMTGQGFSEEKAHDMALCATEAAGNVIKHAEYGWVRIRGDHEVLRISIEDRGPGIHFSNLPSAVLKAGFSTAPSLGMGYSILLELADAVFLSTGDHGTCVILEVSSKVVDPLEAFVGLDLL